MNKQFLDNIWESIIINEEFIWKIINSREMNRLRNISQLGFISSIFPNATHSRFSHSLGTYEAMRRFLNKLSKDLEIKPVTKKALLISALVHDIGHGPYSHIFEKISNINHEKITTILLQHKDSQIHKILYDEGGTDLIDEVIQLIEGKHKEQWANNLVSSDFDVDRLDYLRRDSLNTGTKYGNINVQWLISNISIVENKLVFTRDAIPALESFLISRFQMFKSIYLNKKTISLSAILQFIFNRLENIDSNNKIIKQIKNLSINFDYQWWISFDDNKLKVFIESLSNSNDVCLKELVTMYVENKRAKYELCKNKKIPKKYNNKDFLVSMTSLQKPMFSNDKNKSINILNGNNKIISFIELSNKKQLLINPKLTSIEENYILNFIKVEENV